MSGQDETPRCSLTRTGRSRRRFLEGTALAAGTAALLPVGMAAATKTGGAPASCPDVKTPMKDVTGKVAFITGGDSGIGLGIARACADNGMKVVITYRTQSHLDEAMKLLADAGDRIHAINLDVTDRAAFDKAAQETLDKFQKVHMVVANAGVGTGGGLSRATYDDYDFTIGVNTTGVFNTVHTFLPHIQAHGEGGQVVATSSLAGLIGHGPLGVYTASKFAVVGMMEALRCEFDAAGTNIGVTLFCPGIVTTNIGDSARNRPANLSDTGMKLDPKMAAQMQERMKTMRSGPPPGMDPLEAGRRVLDGVRNNDLYVLTTPEFEDDFRSRGEAIVASLPADVHPTEQRVAVGRMLVGKTVYSAERDRRRCRGATRKA